MTESHSDHQDLWETLQQPIPFCTIDPSGDLTIRGETYSVLNQVHSGEYGKLYSILCMRTGKQFVWKVSNNPKKGLKTEALLQKIAWKTLTNAGFPTAIPVVHEIFDHPVYGIGFFMEHYQTAEIFYNFLQKKVKWLHPCEENDHIFVEVFIQLAMYLWILEQKLQMNHRDLKSSNIIMIRPEADLITIEKTIGSYRFRFKRNFHAVLIDFGFACTQLPTSKLLAAGDYLPKFDGCPKRGRDFFVLLGHLWNLPEVRASVTPRLASWFKERLQTEQKQWWSVVEKLYKHATAQICLFTTTTHFDVPECSPIRILETLSCEFPLWLQRLKTDTSNGTTLDTR